MKIKYLILTFFILVSILTLDVDWVIAGNDFKELEKSEIDGVAVSDSIKLFYLDPIIVTATRTENRIFGLPRAVTIVRSDEIIRKNKLSILDNLNGHNGVWAEKRTSTTSDPVIRGMSGYNILALIDGNTLSTLWGEGGAAGDDMYGKIDAENVDRIEIVRGPSSFLYGSNALAGVINFITKSPPYDFTDENWKLGLTTKYSYASAATEKRGRTEIYGASDWMRFLLGMSYRDIGDAKAGGRIGKQVPTSGDDLNWDIKIFCKTSQDHSFEMSIQDINRDNLHRYYRPTEKNSNDRTGLSLKYVGNNLLLNQDELITSLYYQYKKDTRYFLSTNDVGWAITKTYCGDFQWSSILKRNHYITTGIHYEMDIGENPDDEQLTRQSGDTIIKDAPDSNWRNYSFYVQDEWDFNNFLILNLVLRWDAFVFETNLDTLYKPPSGVDPLVHDISENENTITGGAGIIAGLSKNVNLFFNFSRGFRQYAPVIGIKQHAYGVQVPAGLLNPATNLNYEFGLKFLSEFLRYNLVVYYSSLRDFPTVVPGLYQGEDWYDWNQSGTREHDEDVYITASAAEAYVYGIETDIKYLLRPGFKIGGGFAWNYGNDKTRDEPLRHTTPSHAVMSVEWEEPRYKKLWLSFDIETAGEFERIPSDRIQKDPGYRVDPQDMNSPLINGTGKLSGWTIFNFRTEYKLLDYFKINTSLENIFNKWYRRAHSRWDELGRNFVIEATVKI